MTRPTRYKENNSSRDWIDEFCATKSVEEVRGAFLFNMGKYQRRYGKKDDHLQEAMKIQDYANRLVEYERSLVKPIKRELYDDKAEHADGWVTHDGYGCPVPPDVVVRYTMKDGVDEGIAQAGNLRWDHSGLDGDIIAYKVIEL